MYRIYTLTLVYPGEGSCGSTLSSPRSPPSPACCPAAPPVPATPAAPPATCAPGGAAGPSHTGGAAGASHGRAAGPGTNYAVDDPFTSARTAWWREARFGMFVHFGDYSAWGGEYTRPDGTVCRDAEWIQNRCSIPWHEYEAAAAKFNPSKFDGAAIAKLGRDAGQKYVVITAKHHDGYAMWPTKVNTWNLRDHSSF